MPHVWEAKRKDYVNWRMEYMPDIKGSHTTWMNKVRNLGLEKPFRNGGADVHFSCTHWKPNCPIDPRHQTLCYHSIL